jgi:hypothetical protein
MGTIAPLLSHILVFLLTLAQQHLNKYLNEFEYFSLDQERQRQRNKIKVSADNGIRGKIFL